MNTRLLTAVAAVAALAAASPAVAAPKQIKQTYDVQLPVPFPVTEDVPDMYGCNDGQEGASKNTRHITLPSTGMFTAKADFEGDWDLYLFDSKGSLVAQSEADQSGSVAPGVEKLTWKKAKKGSKVSLVVCNWLGLPDGTVSYTFTYSR